MCFVSSSRTLLSEVLQLPHIAFTIPVTSAIAEGTFFSLHSLKNTLRLSMTQTRLNHIMVLHVHKDKTDCIDLDDIAKELIQVKEESNFCGSAYYVSGFEKRAHFTENAKI